MTANAPDHSRLRPEAVFRAVAGGAGIHLLEQALRAPPPPPPLLPTVAEGPAPEPVPLPPRRSAMRRAGRRVLRGLRPVVLPLLHRFEWRVRTAVDKSAGLATLSGRVGGLEARLDGLAATELPALRLGIDRLAGILSGLAVNIEQSEHAHRHRAATGQEVQAALVRDQESLARDQSAQARQLEQLSAQLRDVRTVLDAVREDGLQRLSPQIEHGNILLASVRRDLLEHLAPRLDEVAAYAARLAGRGALPLPEGDFLVRSPWGWLLAPADDERLLMALHETAGVLEPGTAAVIAALLRPGDTAVDVGAHIGTLTLVAAQAVTATGRVVALEPGERACALLERSLHVNSLAGRVEVHRCAAGAGDGTAAFFTGDVIGENSLVPPADGDTARSTEVSVRPLDALVPPGPVRLVKIDTEGAELAVWRGMTRLRAEPDLAVIVEFGPSHLRRAGIAVADWLAELQAPGFTAWEIDEAERCLRPLRPPAALEAVFSLNLLLLRQPPAAFGLAAAA